MRMLTAVSAAVVVATVVTLSACVPAEDRSSSLTLAPIQTTSTTIPPTVPPSTTIPPYYEVQSGDTLLEIAISFGIPVEVLMDHNGIVDRNAVRAGQILKLPAPESVANTLPPTVPGQTVPTIAPVVDPSATTTAPVQVAAVPGATTTVP